ncbi:hypothetical protein ACFQJ7_15200 [Halovenus rubra]|uniref:Uncharacterized protein n=2 Tax=Halovenus rubra TaxID=869890 RepID=A0ABD5X7W5_9EURY|nr:hypothetical protein [Halovenus rubra]
MVYRWRCRHCDFSAWGQRREQVANRVKQHLVEHNRHNISDGGMQLQWSCPYCERTEQSTDGSRALNSYKEHLFEHVEALMESGVHVAEDFGYVGSAMVAAPLEGTGADNARIHFLSPGDIIVLVTTNAVRRIQLLQQELSELPAWIVVVTTNDQPLKAMPKEELSSLPIEVVQLDKQLGLSGLGETISRVLSEQEKMDGRISCGFDILPDLVETFDLQKVFQFLHILTNRLEDANALSHFYIDPSSGYEGSANVLEEMFDLRIDATENTFVSGPQAPSGN